MAAVSMRVVRMRSRRSIISWHGGPTILSRQPLQLSRMPEYFSMDDGFVHFRWPFSVYAYGGFWTHSVIIWTGIVGNVFVALCAHRIVQRVSGLYS